MIMSLEDLKRVLVQRDVTVVATSWCSYRGLRFGLFVHLELPEDHGHTVAHIEAAVLERGSMPPRDGAVPQKFGRRVAHCPC